MHICYGYGIEANNKWKETLGAEWRQYEQSFPLLQQSSIDIVSLECIHLVELIRARDALRAAVDLVRAGSGAGERHDELLRMLRAPHEPGAAASEDGCSE